MSKSRYEKIQRELQLSDIEAVDKIKGHLQKKDKFKRKVVKEFIEPLSKQIFQEKLNDLPAIALKIVTLEDIKLLYDIDELKTRDAQLIIRDMLRFVEQKGEYEYLSNKKLKKLSSRAYEEGLKYIFDKLKEASLNIEETLKEHKSQQPQIFALATFLIDSSELSYLILKKFLTIKDIDEMREYEDDEDESEPNTIHKVARMFGEAVETQIAYEKISDDFAKEGKTLSYKPKEWVIELNKRKISDDTIQIIGIRLLAYLEDCGWSNRYKVDDDGEIVELVDKYNRDINNTSEYRVDVLIGYTKEFKQVIEKIENEILMDISLHYDPMVIEPLAWSNEATGGFLPTSREYILPLRKVNTKKEMEYFAKIADSIPQEILDAINTIQSTPYKINRYVYNYLKDEVKRLQKELKSLQQERKNSLSSLSKEYKDTKDAYYPILKLQDIPEESKEPIKELFLNSRKAYFDARKPYNKKIIPLKHKIKQIVDKLQIVDRLLLHGITLDDKIWFVWQMDFRGRIYPVQPYLNPQGDDIAKALLLFGDKKPLGENGLYWLRVHGANLYAKDGLDKKPFDERVKWCIDNEEEIIDSANNPNQSRLLKEAEDPMMFYAFCCEYRDYKQDPDNFKTSLPIAVDGTNNGLQHISTLYRDKESAILVNVLPSSDDTPKDIYKSVAEHTKSKIKKDMQYFQTEKDKLLIDENGLYLVPKNRADVLYWNYCDDNLKDILLSNIDELNKKFSTKGIKALEKELKKLTKPIYRLLSSDQKKDLIAKISKLLRESNFDKDRFTKEYDKCIEYYEKKRKYYYTNDDGLAIETVISPLNFIDEAFLELIDRSLVKPNVMTDSYGSELRTKQNQIYNKLKSIHKEKGIPFGDNSYYLRIVANYIGELNDKSIDEISKASDRYMKWCEESVSKIYKDGINRDKPISWHTPLGLEITQVKFKKRESKYIETAFGSDRVYIRNLQDSDKISLSKQKSGLAPNFIHSLDSTHMFMSINSAKREGVEYFMTIHDSFATHASDIDKLLKALKEEFIKLHKEPIMENLKRELEEKFGEKLEAIEYVDEDFDIEKVRESKYFFA